nr:MAG TPA: hypothetical protein [Bacteriophage sp.]
MICFYYFHPLLHIYSITNFFHLTLIKSDIACSSSGKR